MSTDLMTKLALSKKIMDRHNEIPRSANGAAPTSISSPQIQSFDAPQASYNIPQEIMNEGITNTQPVTENVTPDRILSSKLPDEIKKLMMEHPIQQPTMGMASGAVLSNELVEKASRLMNSNSKGEQVQENVQRRQSQQPTQQSSSLSANEIRNIVRETVEDVLKENGLLVESESKSSDMFKFRVGQHLFEGKVLRVKKIAK